MNYASLAWQVAQSEKTRKIIMFFAGILVGIILIIVINIFRKKALRDKYLSETYVQNSPYYFAQKIFESCPKELGAWWIPGIFLINKAKNLLTDCDEQKTLDAKAGMIEFKVSVAQVAAAFKNLGYGDLREHLDGYLDEEQLNQFYN